jgi:sialic acid synthase SpsE
VTTEQTPKIEIIAELAQGFEGSPVQSALLLKAAATAGADAAKFQLVYADELGTPDYLYFNLFKSLEMADEVWSGLAEQAKAAGIALQVDVFGERSLALASRIGVETVKLHGTDINNLGFLESVAKSSVRRVMLGAGGAMLKEIERALDLLKGKEVVVLLGFQGYPTPNDGNQIARVAALVQRWRGRAGVTVGFADHAAPEHPTRYALAAVALGAGARVFEKHLTLGKVMKLEDHESALNPDEFAEFCGTLRDCAAAFGSSADAEDFGMSESEQGYRKMIRRHVIAARDLKAGTMLGAADLMLKRSAASEFVTDLEAAYGKTLSRAIAAGTPLSPTDIGAAS